MKVVKKKIVRGGDAYYQAQVLVMRAEKCIDRGLELLDLAMQRSATVPKPWGDDDQNALATDLWFQFHTLLNCLNSMSGDYLRVVIGVEKLVPEKISAAQETIDQLEGLGLRLQEHGLGNICSGHFERAGITGLVLRAAHAIDQLADGTEAEAIRKETAAELIEGFQDRVTVIDQLCALLESLAAGEALAKNQNEILSRQGHAAEMETCRGLHTTEIERLRAFLIACPEGEGLAKGMRGSLQELT